MPGKRPTPRSICLRAAIVFLAAALALTLAAGIYLEMNPQIGGWAYSSERAPVGPTYMSTSGHHQFVRTPGGIRLGSPVGSWAALAPPPGTPLGTAKFELKQIATGWPEFTRIEWTLDVTNIAPAPGGPPASDVAAWRAIVAEAGSASPSWHGPAPAAVLAGGTTGVRHFPLRFASNVAARLWHAPLWLGSCLAAAVLVSIAPCIRPIRVMRRAPGHCAACGYDRRGIADAAPCPECGRGPEA